MNISHNSQPLRDDQVLHLTICKVAEPRYVRRSDADIGRQCETEQLVARIQISANRFGTPLRMPR